MHSLTSLKHHFSYSVSCIPLKSFQYVPKSTSYDPTPAIGFLLWLLLMLCVCVCVCVSLSCVWLSANPWTVARQAPPFMDFSGQEYWNGWPFHSSGDLPDPGIELGSPVLKADSLLSEPPGKPLLMLVSTN